MRHLTHGTASAVVLAAAGIFLIAGDALGRVVVSTRGPRYRAAPSSHEIVLEGGLAEPMGDQSDPLFTTQTGFGSGTGYQLGARWRQYLGPSFAVSPAFHYVRFGTATGVADFGNQQDLAYYVRTSLYRYGLDFQAFVGQDGAPLRLFLTGGIALVNNRLRDELQSNGYFQDSVNAPAYSAGLGLKMRNIELTGEYTWNRFDTSKFYYDSSDPNGNGVPRSYNWDQLVVRVGISFGR